jgi:D-glycero-D-manno-heptose 1,7-bisphosphate phosphatase
MKKYILLDRDGVINHDSDDFIKSPEEWLPLEKSLEAIALLNQHGYKIAVITNQSGIARGYLSKKMLNIIHAKMRDEVSRVGGSIEEIYFCPHQASDECKCRKPKAGLIKQFAADYGVDLSQIYFIGDSLRDIQASQNAGTIPVLVKTGNGVKTLQENPEFLTSLLIFENLYDAAKSIINR